MTSFRLIKIQNSEQFEYLTDCSSACDCSVGNCAGALRKRKQDISFCYLHWNGGKFEKRQSDQKLRKFVFNRGLACSLMASDKPRPLLQNSLIKTLKFTEDY